jgi:hypothetical protein
VIDLGNDDDPAALVAMLKFCYEGAYSCYSPHKSPADHHLAMYRLADLYDMSDLRKEASRRLIASLGPVESAYDTLWIQDDSIGMIQQILGPEADSFADNSIQKDVYKHITVNIKTVYKNALFRNLLADESMFNETFSQKFTDKIGEIITNPHRLCHCCPPTPGSMARSVDWSAPTGGIRW